MKKFNGGPAFDSIQLGEASFDLLRGVEKLKFAYHDSKTKTNLGFIELPSRGLLSKKTLELRNQLIASLEEDAVRVLSRNQDTATEVNDERDPPGLADASEEADQI